MIETATIVAYTLFDQLSLSFAWRSHGEAPMSSEAALRSPHSLATVEALPNDSPQISRPIIADAHDSKLGTLSDEELLSHVVMGSKESVGVLFRRHGRAVLQVAWRILRDESEAADVRQDVFLYIFEKARLFDPSKGSGSSWIMQVAYHRAIDRRRYLANRQHYDAPVFDEQRSSIGAAPPSTDVIDGKAILDRMRETLSGEQRETLELHLFEGYSLREIAERSGQSLGNVRHHYYRALDRLRTHIFPRKCE